MKSIVYLAIACAMVTCALCESRDILLKQINSHVGDSHGYSTMNGQSKLGDISPEALPLCLELATAPEMVLDLRTRYNGIVAHYLHFFPERVPSEKRAMYIDALLEFIVKYCMESTEEIERGPCATAFAHLSSFYDKRILELGKKWVNQNPDFLERQQVYYYEKKFHDMEKIGYSPEKWREIVQRKEPPLGPLNERRNAETTKQRTWWLALLGLILLVPFTAWIKRALKRSS